MKKAIEKIRWKVDYLKTADNRLVIVKGILNYKIGDKKNSHADDLKLNLYQNLTKKLQPHVRKVKFNELIKVEHKIELLLQAELKVFGYEFLSFTSDWREIKTLTELREHLRGKIIHLHTGEYIKPYVNEFKPPLFNWDEVPGKDDDKLKKFLKDEFGLKWVDMARIEKIDNNKKINVLYDKKCVSLILDNPNPKSGKTIDVILKTDDNKTVKLAAKSVKSQLNVYQPKKYKHLSNALDAALRYFLSKKYGGERRKMELEKEWKII